jgi:hypothetical protein
MTPNDYDNPEMDVPEPAPIPERIMVGDLQMFQNTNPTDEPLFCIECGADSIQPGQNYYSAGFIRLCMSHSIELTARGASATPVEGTPEPMNDDERCAFCGGPAHDYSLDFHPVVGTAHWYWDNAADMIIDAATHITNNIQNVKRHRVLETLLQPARHILHSIERVVGPIYADDLAPIWKAVALRYQQRLQAGTLIPMDGDAELLAHMENEANKSIGDLFGDVPELQTDENGPMSQTIDVGGMKIHIVRLG